MGTAACITRGDARAIESLPDTRGLKPRVLIQRGHRYKYVRMARIAGAEIVYVGDGAGTSPDELRQQLSDPRVAMLLFPAHLDARVGTVPLAEAAAMARSRGVPTLVDAAYMCDPPMAMRRFTDAGTDLVCFSAKYWYGPNTGGFIGGRARLVELVSQLDFTRFESGSVLRFGRPFKLDRHGVVGTMLSLEEWFRMDHGARWAGYANAVGVLAESVRHLPGVSSAARCFTMQETLEERPINCLVISLDPAAAGLDAATVHRLLREGDPSIAVHLDAGTIIITMDAMAPGAERMVARRLRAILTRS